MAAIETWLIKLRSLLCNRYTLAAAVYGFAFFFLLSRGPDRFFLYLVQGLVIIHLLFPEYRSSCLRGPYVALVLIAAFPVATTLLMPEDLTYRRWFDNVFDLVWVVLSMRLLTLQMLDSDPRPYALLALAMLWVLVIGNLAATIPILEPWLKEPMCDAVGWGLKCGLTKSPHFLSLLAVVTLPLAIYLTWYLTGTVRIAAAAALVGLTCLLVISGSRPGWVALLLGMVVTVLYLMRTPGKWWVAIGMLVLPVVAYVFGVGGIDDRVDDLVVNFGSEERLVLWPDTWRMIQDSSLQGWLLGHGIGSYRYYFPEYSTIAEYAVAAFSHNFVLDIWFESGLLGLALIGGGIAGFLLALARISRQASTPAQSYFCVTLFATCIMLLVHTGLTLPFYSRPTLLPLAMVLGLGLAIVVLQRDRLAAGDLDPRG